MDNHYDKKDSESGIESSDSESSSTENKVLVPPPITLTSDEVLYLLSFDGEGLSFDMLT